MDMFGDDPDFKYLQYDRQKLMEEQSMPYDGKKSCWVVDEKEGFAKAEITSTKGDDVTVKLTDIGGERTVKKDALSQMNPPKFEKLTDMANLTYLNEASVLYNLAQRYRASLIYTYSGLFCIAVNPYRRLPIYTQNVIHKYQGKKKNEMPPHLFSVADNAYRNMVMDREHQSCLITGESGAGKTENTKKVISYFAQVASCVGDRKEGEPGLEDKIVQCNPVLEAWGNAKTIRNNNSSRFGKFIRIHFGPNTKIAGADVETYLLEKSRVTYQQPGLERNYHIFYWLLCGAQPDYADRLLAEADAGLYFYINQGCLTVDNMDDPEEMRLVDECFEVLGFKDEEKWGTYKTTMAVVWFGEMKFKQRPREEQAEADGNVEAEKVAFLLGVNSSDLLKAMLKPKVKVGNEYVVKGQTKDQVIYSTAALAKAMYAKMFAWLVLRVNKTLDTKNKRQFFIGVLDIAGFEIFEYNTFEQLCINYTNERLQQFFNHHMFVLEQEEYKKEGIQWVFIDFGMDLEACINLIEKPMGILSILEEECMFPKASDKSFLGKLYDNHLGKTANFIKPKPSKQKKRFEPHFEVAHYAGTVGYNTEGWLDKNKDPINDTVVGLLKVAKEPLVAVFFSEPEADAAASGKGAKKKKGGAFATISAVHKEQLHKLMHNLYTTHPHFVRCLIPNEQKCPGAVEAHLILHQLQCNGVLEGIRICQIGLPNRLLYAEFKQRYTILCPNAVPEGFADAKIASEKVLLGLQLDPEKYRLGNTKVFFRAGVLGELEDLRDERLTSMISNFQAFIRGYVMRKNYSKLENQRVALDLIQRNIRRWLALRNWQWWKLYTRIKPLLSQMRAEEEIAAKLAELEETIKKAETLEKAKKDLEEQGVVLLQQKNEVLLELEARQDACGEDETKIMNLVNDKADLEVQVKELEESLAEAESGGSVLAAATKKLEGNVNNLKKDLEDLNLNLNKAEQDKSSKDNQIKTLNDEMARQDETLSRLNKEKKSLDEGGQKLSDALAAEEDKYNHLSKLKEKLESSIDELEENLEREKKARADVEKSKRKIETDLKMSQETVEELDRIKRDLEDNVRRKDTELGTLNSKLEDEQNLVAQLQKKIKELQSHIAALEEELHAEWASKSKTEKARSELSTQLDELSERLDEAGGATIAHADMNKKREQELVKLRRDLEAAHLHSEQNINTLRKRQNDAVNELTDQIDQLQKVKSKVDKEKNHLKAESDELQGQLDHVNKGKGNADRLGKTLDAQLGDCNAKLDEASRNIAELESLKSRLVSDNNDLGRKVDEAENQLSQLNRAKQTLSKQLDEAKLALEEETNQRMKFQNENRNMQGDLDTLREQFEEEQEGRGDLQRQLTKANNEIQIWRRKLESGEGGVRSEEVDEVKRKFTSRLQECEAHLEAALSKCNSLDKAKHRIEGELMDVSLEMERSQSIASQAEKRQRVFDKTVDEWKRKVHDLTGELDSANSESRGNAAEVFKLRAQLDEVHETIEALRRENKNLAGEIHDLTDQLSDGGRSVHELDKARRRLELEKEELQSALEEAEAALEQEEAKVQRASLEITSIKQDIDRRLAEKDEEFEATRKNHQRSVESMQASLESETRGKAEALRMKKKLDADINELEIALDGANRGRADAEKNIKKLQQTLREIQVQIEDEQRARDEARELYSAAERRANALASEIEELRSQLESAERARKAAESELHEASDRVSELSAQNTSLVGSKRKLEADMSAMQTDLEDTVGELRSAEETSKRAMGDAARMSEELRQEQEHAGHIEKLRRTAESQVKELQVRLDEAEANAMKGGRRMIQKLEQRVRELEVELDNEQRRHAETQKGLRKQDRRLKELAFQAEEDRKSMERLQDMIEKLQQKIKTYKRQVEEAEEIAAINLTKYRKVQHDLEEAEERADMAETSLGKLRAKHRSSSMSRTVIGGGVKLTITERTTSS